MDGKQENKMSEHKTATLAGGCFWCVEAVFELVEGIHTLISGYTGGNTENPTYEEVCSGQTGHAEAVQIEYDPDVIDYETILEIFFAYHDPTTLNRQGNDIGTQYRSAIYFHDKEQEEIAIQVVQELEEDEIFPNPIVTEINEIGTFYRGEAFHQSYFTNNAYQPYCQFIIAPKVIKLRERHSHLLKTVYH